MKSRLLLVGFVLMGAVVGFAGLFLGQVAIYSALYPRTLDSWMYRMIMSLTLWHGAILGGLTGASFFLSKSSRLTAAAKTCIIGGLLEFAQLALWHPNFGQPNISTQIKLTTAYPWFAFLAWAIVLIVVGVSLLRKSP